MVYCIGLSGQKRSGKDTVCNILKPLLDKEFSNFERVSFADSVKNMLCLFSYKENGKSQRVTREWIEANKENAEYIPDGWNMNTRSALINIGDRLREICPNVWIDILMNNYRTKNKIITDVRYPNEIFAIKEFTGNLIIRIIRPDFYKREGDRSEISLLEYDKFILNDYEGEILDKEIPYDYIIRNSGSEKDLEEKIRNKVFPYILGKWKYFTEDL